MAIAKVNRKHPDYLRTVLLSKITPYIYWQKSLFDNNAAAINVCIVESGSESIDQLLPYFSLLNQRQVGERKFVVWDVRQFAHMPESMPDICHMYYFAEVTQEDITRLVELANQRSVLTVADSLDEMKQGAMIGFIEEKGKLKIYINLEAIDKSAVRVKSSLIRIARKI